MGRSTGSLWLLRSLCRQISIHVPRALAADGNNAAFEIEIIGDRRKATIIPEPPFDPQAKRMRMQDLRL
jgi:glycine cleavage system aminomethyltransferase T